MIKIDYLLDNNNFNFRSTGHAYYDVKGKDIVCSAVSSIIIGSLNALDGVENYNIKIKSGNVSIIANNITSHDRIVFETMIIQLQTVESEFNENLKVIRREQ